MTKAGHNSADERLKLFIERVENLIEERKGINDDMKDVFNEAKGEGYDTKIMRQIIRLRAMDPEARITMEHLIDQYKHALGMDLV